MTLYVGHIKLFAEASELFVHAVFQLIMCEMMPRGASFRGQDQFNLEGDKLELYGG
jgi:hypothetical protein